MSQVPFTFQFDIPTDERRSPTAPASSSQEAKDDSSTSNNQSGGDTAKAPFHLVKNISDILRDRSHETLEYDTVELTDLLSPLFRVRGQASSQIHAGTIQNLEQLNTDLVPGVYEGGLKVWECSLDLCRYLAVHWEEILTNDCGSILELGCGHGLPACLLLREGLQRGKKMCVMFTDYNDFVIHGVALSNIVLNTRSIAEPVLAESVVMGAGDWMDMSEQLCAGVLQKEATNLPGTARFHVILAAETTYTTQSARDTATLMARHLAVETGVGLIACKRYYFGVGGGSDAFREAAACQKISIPIEQDPSSMEYQLSVETLEVYDNGVGNIRELLLVKCIPKL